MTGPYFIDTNLLLYWRDTSEVTKQPQASAWLGYLLATEQAVLSAQVLNEFYVNATRKLCMPVDYAQQDMRDLLQLPWVQASPLLYEMTWDLQARYSLSFWDGLIVAAALAGECKTLLSEDMQDGLQIGALTIMNPFRVSPPS